MLNVAIMLALLLAPYWALIPAHVAEPERARIGVALVFAFTGIGHKHSQTWSAQTHRMVILVPALTGIGGSIFFTKTRLPSGKTS
ncbi:MAG TPA: hypothetical protein VGN61_08470 [Verrucomicrobiae bacterium]